MEGVCCLPAVQERPSHPGGGGTGELDGLIVPLPASLCFALRVIILFSELGTPASLERTQWILLDAVSFSSSVGTQIDRRAGIRALGVASSRNKCKEVEEEGWSWPRLLGRQGVSKAEEGGHMADKER